MKKIIPFYGKTNPILSNHYVVEEGFEMDGHIFYSSEQAFAYNKAANFHHKGCMKRVLKEKDPKEIKKMLRGIPCYKGPYRFDPEIWERDKEDCMYEAIEAKFSVPRLREYLESTGDAILAECAPRDVYWGTGYGRERTANGESRGLNRMGELLMGLRAGENRAQEGQWVNFHKGFKVDEELRKIKFNLI